MQIRASRISSSIARAISREYNAKKTLSTDIVQSFLAFFTFFKLVLTRYRPADFLTLRHEAWELDEDEYLDSFHDAQDEAEQSTRGKGKENATELVPAGDLGYSGSTFFTTANDKFLIKSLPRKFEHDFFTHDLFDAYVAHVKETPHSLLVRITDMVYTPYPSLGGILGMAPTHHIVMENLLFGKQFEEDESIKADWETYDLKPNTYFFPERDIADGNLASDSVKDKLVDNFEGHVYVPKEAKSTLVDLLEADTKLLADRSAIDYSLFLIRYPGPNVGTSRASVPAIRSRANEWRTGVDDVDGKWTYRAIVLDFFWAKNKLQAKAMTGLVDTFNLVADQGPMSITADPQEYRKRFMKMVDDIVKGQD